MKTKTYHFNKKFKQRRAYLLKAKGMKRQPNGGKTTNSINIGVRLPLYYANFMGLYVLSEEVTTSTLVRNIILKKFDKVIAKRTKKDLQNQIVYNIQTLWDFTDHIGFTAFMETVNMDLVHNKLTKKQIKYITSKIIR